VRSDNLLSLVQGRGFIRILLPIVNKEKTEEKKENKKHRGMDGGMGKIGGEVSLIWFDLDLPARRPKKADRDKKNPVKADNRIPPGDSSDKLNAANNLGRKPNPMPIKRLEKEPPTLPSRVHPDTRPFCLRGRPGAVEKEKAPKGEVLVGAKGEAWRRGSGRPGDRVRRREEISAGGCRESDYDP